MTILISGSSGLIGRALAAALAARRHRVARLTRRMPNDDSIDVAWDPGAPGIDRERLELLAPDVVVHLAGESIAGGRWTAARRAGIFESRVRSTQLLTAALTALKRLPRLLITASAVGYYGNRGEERLREDAPAGSGFLSDVCQAWERAAEPAARGGIRHVATRFGVVLSRDGGALSAMILPFRLGLGGRIGSGRQYMSWIALEDVVGALVHVIEHEEIRGPVNVTAPAPVTNAEFARALGRALSRPAVLPLPALAVRLLLGEMGRELLLAGARVEPTALLASGYEFRFPALDQALRHAVGRD